MTKHGYVALVTNEPAYILHRYDWSESSLILEVFTRHHGRIALVAKGAKKPSSSFRPVLLPLQMLRVSFGGDAEIRTLKSAEWRGGHIMPTGDSLLSGYYLNELVLTLLAREDAHPSLFDVYAQTVAVLASESSNHPRSQRLILQAALRTWELLLLREVGFLPPLDGQTLSLQTLQPNTAYCLVPEGGLRLAHSDDRAILLGSQWLQLHTALNDNFPFHALLPRCAEWNAALKPQLRSLLHHHCGVKMLRTRQMMMDIHSL
ncbi:MAG: hypothetical protein RIR79_649 [Pseudomonadota bacterium]|jgi:DNA repair protein RecO (recombination protein O)